MKATEHGVCFMQDGGYFYCTHRLALCTRYRKSCRYTGRRKSRERLQTAALARSGLYLLHRTGGKNPSRTSVYILHICGKSQTETRSIKKRMFHKGCENRDVYSLGLCPQKATISISKCHITCSLNPHPVERLPESGRLP